MTTPAKPKPIGELLKEKGIITDSHIQYALQEQKITKEKLGELFERLGFVTENDVVLTLAQQFNVDYIDVDAIIPEEDLLKRFNKTLCLNNVFLPIRRVDQKITVAAHNVNDDKIKQIVARQAGLQPKMLISESKRSSMPSTSFIIF